MKTGREAWEGMAVTDLHRNGDVKRESEFDLSRTSAPKVVREQALPISSGDGAADAVWPCSVNWRYCHYWQATVVCSGHRDLVVIVHEASHHRGV